MSHKPTIKDLLRAHQAIKEDTPAMDMEPIHKLFGKGDNIPHIDESQVGWIRLLRAVKNKFGANYRAIPEVDHALNHYEKEVKFIKLYKKIKGDRHGRD